MRLFSIPVDIVATVVDPVQITDRENGGLVDDITVFYVFIHESTATGVCLGQRRQLGSQSSSTWCHCDASCLVCEHVLAVVHKFRLCGEHVSAVYALLDFYTVFYLTTVSL